MLDVIRFHVCCISFQQNLDLEERPDVDDKKIVGPVN